MTEPHQFFRIGPHDVPAPRILVVLEDGAWDAPSGPPDTLEPDPDTRNDAKLALSSITVQSPQEVVFRLRRTTWLDVQRARAAASADDRDRFIQRADGRTDFLVPNILAVHVVCLTSDSFVPVFQRSHDSAYHPGAWSASFEEGLEPSDLHGCETFATAARRGAAEELSQRFRGLDTRLIMLLAAIAERPESHPAIVLLLRLPCSAEQLLQWLHDTYELVQGSTDFIDARPGKLSRFLASMDHDPRAWHPTVRYRLACLRDHLLSV